MNRAQQQFGPPLELVTKKIFPALNEMLAEFVRAAPFAVLHGPQYGWSWRHIVLLVLVGIAFGWQRYRTGSSFASTAAHASYNAFMFTAYMASEGDMLGKW